MFEKSIIKSSNNLLAFSAGVDSSALFFILLEMNINFDLVIINYNIRPQAKEEILYAKQLAKKYNKKIYIKTFNNPKFNEKIARDFRYDFFDEIILNNNYDSLITAHQLNDKVEWFLMQLSKGAGLVELLGLLEVSNRKNYIVYKPLLNTSKDDLLKYLHKNNHKYFVDSTNCLNIYKRNEIRNNFSNDFVKQYEQGLKKSFKYLNNDIDSLYNLNSTFILHDLIIAKFTKYDENSFIRVIDKKLKEFGLIISSATRQEIIKQKYIVISNKIAISICEELIYIAPFTVCVMNKDFKDICRIHNIPKNIRQYLNTLKRNEFEKFIIDLEIFKK